ncbi:M50 family metallopeptidase [Pontibacter cellulosilyticus]|uniref:M50 family metallopeptidase n=1 Tax=Pontibacter cellulosilyticus TaxID=1720253 RepID=A0A923SMH4_9BACT|nr:M50 family metallopeptidase [Pontibacter cellulosilyticus]MBC5992200.1 M50 family metallopeptidase [Pontibacter cellulosilyticus]
MFGINDIPKFFLAFFLVLPIISFVHEAGHVFFAWLMGGKNIKVTVGSGGVLFRVGMLELRKYYFWYGLCTFDNLKRNERFSNILIFSGGAIFNSLAALIIIYLIENKTLEPGIITYQFTYFSLYYVFFALLPMPYPDGNQSDGKVILDLLRNKEQVKTYRVQWSGEKSQWCVLDHDRNLVQAFDDEEQAVTKAHEVAQQNRPSRLVNSKSGKETEVGNYPKVPL